MAFGAEEAQGFAKNSDDVRIYGYGSAVAPGLIQAEIPVYDELQSFVLATRDQCTKLISRADPKRRLLVIVGPCSLHDPISAIEYAEKLRKEAIDRYNDDLLIVMRAYLEKPRTIVGWKGMINDPDVDGTFKINKGLRVARKLYRELVTRRVPIAGEMLDTISPQYVCDLLTWGAIGARTTESQLHRELASGLSFPVGFKNGTDGNTKIAIEAIKSAAHPHHFLSVTKQGHVAIVSTTGNEDCHIILRGGQTGPNYFETDVEQARQALNKAKLVESIMIDCSHGNSSKNYKNQPKVAADIAAQIAAGNESIVGVMIESHLIEGRQDIPNNGPTNLTYGQSITDACLGWEDTLLILNNLAKAVQSRRRHRRPD